MSVRQIPLVVSWIAAIHPAGKMDQNAVADQMSQELGEAAESRLAQYYIGYVKRMPAFFLVGVRLGEEQMPPAKEGDSRYDYEMATFLVNPLITKELTFPLLRRAIQFIFEIEPTCRILYQLGTNPNIYEQLLHQLGFRQVLQVGSNKFNRWYGCP